MRWRTPAALVASLFTFASCQDASMTDPAAPAPVDLAPVMVLGEGASNAVPDQYIVVLDDAVTNVPERVQELVDRFGAQRRFTYERALKGFAARLPQGAAEALARHPLVKYVEADRTGGIVATQTNATWGLDRTDQRDLPLSTTYTYGNDGSGVHAYILDTGVRLSHTDFGGRAAYVPNGTNGDFVGDGQGNAADCHGHGSHVAGTVAGASWGVAKGASVWAARVVNCSGSGDVSMAIAAVDWVTANGQRPAVVNMSLGYGNVQALRDAVENSVAAGVTYAVAAGNGHWLFGYPLDACGESPAGAPNALTVGATNSSDGEASFSNYGTCVDILAPGVSVTSAWYDSDTSTNTISGTSMATPHVAGAAALYLSATPGATPADVAAALTGNATTGRIALHSSSQSGGTPNALLYTGFIGGGGTPPANQAPTASFSESCTNLSCTFTDASSDSDGTVVAWSWDFGDGGTSASQNPTHTYGAAGTYTVTLTVTDDDGATDASSRSVTVSAPAQNQAPVASFTESCTNLSCAFTDGSSDSDGSVVSWSWDFGDGNGSASQNPSHTYGAAGSYTVSLTVTDNEGATDTATRTVTVTAPPPPAEITLSVRKRDFFTYRRAELTWTGASGNQVDIYRNGALLVTTANDGSHVDSLGWGFRGTMTYRVCQAGTQTCSPDRSLTW